MRIEHTEVIDAPLAQVWDLTVDVEGLPDVTPTITSVERLDREPIGPGSEVRIKQPGQRQRVWTITDFEPRRKLAWSTKALGMTMTGIHELEESDAGTANTLAIELTGPMASLIGPLLGNTLRKTLATENQGFKTSAES